MPDISERDRELLYMLAEEASEVIKAVTKILRHGFDSTDPTRSLPVTNTTDLMIERHDFIAVQSLCRMYGSEQLKAACRLDESIVQRAVRRKQTYMHTLPQPNPLDN